MSVNLRVNFPKNEEVEFALLDAQKKSPKESGSVEIITTLLMF